MQIAGGVERGGDAERAQPVFDLLMAGAHRWRKKCAADARRILGEKREACTAIEDLLGAREVGWRGNGHWV
jgi:hypothetical protein